MSFLIAAMVMAAATAGVDCPAGGDPSIPRVRANWKKAPTPESVMWAYPPKAAAIQQTGKVMMRCQIDAEGKVTDCKVLSETPADFGFGEAAVSLKTQMEFTPESRCGKPTPSEVTIPITFTAPERPATPESLPDLAAQLLGRRLATALQLGEDAENSISNYGDTLIYRTSDRSVSAEQRRAFYDALREIQPKARQIVLEASGLNLARSMDQQDLETAVAFYESHSGQALVRAQSAFRYQTSSDAMRAGLEIRDLVDAQFCAITKICDLHPAPAAQD